MFRLPRRPGFTLVEFVVVAGIVATLLSLSVPAVMRVREEANRISCANNLQMLALAVHHYDAARKRMPPGYLGPPLSLQTAYPFLLTTGQWVGHLPALAPYLEASSSDDLRVNLNTEQVAQLPWFKSSRTQFNVANYEIAKRSLPFLICPSSPNYPPEFGNPDPGHGGTLLGIHTFNDNLNGVFNCGWKDVYTTTAQYRFLGKTHYMGVAGCSTGNNAALNRYTGVFTNRSANRLALVSARDGTSNTLLYGEAQGTHLETSAPETADISWMAMGALSTFGGLPRRGDATVFQFTSSHPAGVHFAMATAAS